MSRSRAERIVLRIALLPLVTASREAQADEPNCLGTVTGYAQFFASTFAGGGLRFDNPYRLATPARFLGRVGIPGSRLRRRRRRRDARRPARSAARWTSRREDLAEAGRIR